MNPSIILGQALGILATVITCLSYQMNTKRSLLIWQTIATGCSCLSFLFLGASDGFLLNIVCIVRNITFYFEKERTPLCYLSAGLLAILMGVIGALSWQGAHSLLIILALMANTIFMSLGNPQLLRYSVVVTSTMVLIYNIFVFSIGGMANEGISVVSSIVGIIRFSKAKERTEQAPTQSSL